MDDEVGVPGWTEEIIEDLEEGYEEDVDMITLMDDIDFIETLI